MKTAKVLFLGVAVLQAASFETASIKPSSPDASGTHSNSDGLFLRIGNFTVRRCIMKAWGIPEDRVLGGPVWLDRNRYDIEARAAQTTSGLNMNAMLQSLLAERFQLMLHHETRSLPGFALMVVKGGVKMKISTPDVAGTPPGSRTGGPGRGGVGRTDNYHGITMAQLAVRLADQLGAPVEDATGLADSYDFSLTWSPEATQLNGTAGEFADGLSLLTALQEQLGLKVESKKVPTDMLVIDHAELPTEN